MRVWWLLRKTSFVTLLVSVALVLQPAPSGSALERTISREWAFVANVLLASETSGNPGRITRWQRPFTVQIIDAGEKETGFILRYLSELNSIISGSGVKISILDSQKSDVAIMFARSGDIPGIAKYLKLKMSDAASGYAWQWADANFKYTNAFVLVRSDQLLVERLTTVAHELLHVVGAEFHSSEFRESVLFKRANEPSSATRLSPVDRKLLRFLYLHLEPGDDRETVRKKFNRVWRSVPSD